MQNVKFDSIDFMQMVESTDRIKHGDFPKDKP